MAAPPRGVTTFTLPRPTLSELLTGALDLGAAIEAGTIEVDGDPTVLKRLLGLIAPVDHDLDIVTP